MSNRLLFSEPMRLQAPALPRLPARSRWAAFKAAWRRYRSRQRITTLDAYLLKDIGVSFAEAEAEANKPLWRL